MNRKWSAVATAFVVAVTSLSFTAAARGGEQTGAGPAAPYGKVLPGTPCEAAKNAKPGTGWICFDPAASKAQLDKRIAERDAGKTESIASSTHYCKVSGCWDVQSTVSASYDGVGAYGIVDSNGQYRQIGQTDLDITDTTGSGVFTHKPFCWSSTASTRNIYLIVERFYVASRSVPGSSLSPRVYILSPTKSSAVAGTGYCLPLTGNYKPDGTKTNNTTFANAHSQYTSYHYVTWRDTHGYPGKWWMQAKSVLAYKRDSGAYWYWQDATYLPTNPANAGWIPD